MQEALKSHNFNLSPEILQNPQQKVSVHVKGILYIKALKKNTFITLTNLRGKVEARHSCGSMGFQGKKKRKTKFAYKTTLHAIARKAVEADKNYLFVCISGYANLKSSVFSCFKKHNLKIVGIRDITPHPHNGCRSIKRRRV